MQSFIKVLLAVKALSSLEGGDSCRLHTSMCEYGPEKLQVITIENYGKKDSHCQRKFTGRSHQITLLEGDAGQILRELELV